MNMSTEYEDRKKLIKDIIDSPEYKPMKYKELVYLLQLKDEDKPVLSRILQELTEEEVIMKTPRGKYQKLSSDTKVGIFTGNANGYGFVTVEGEDADYFVAGRDVNGALHQDTVLIRVVEDSEDMESPRYNRRHRNNGSGKEMSDSTWLVEDKQGKSGGRERYRRRRHHQGPRKEAQILKVLKRGITELVGTYDPARNYGFVVPDNVKYNSDIYIPKAYSNQARRGQKVVVQILNYGDRSHKPEGRITEILGFVNDPGTDVVSIVKAYELPEEFEDMVMRAAARMPEQVSGKEMEGRKDLRSLQTVTIDGEDAKDLDDAITIRRTDHGYELGVHIADVSHYVTEHSPLDEEALRRGTSIYLIDQVIPMLPFQLSNGICSLNQGEDRLALSCIMQMDEKGMVVSHEIAETVICVDRRMNYSDVNKILEEHDPELSAKYADFLVMFATMKELADILREQRVRRGSIDFDFPESKILLDEQGFPIEISQYERRSANMLIEDFMLIANETVAEDYFWQELPFVYRTHETPDAEKLDALSVMMANFGYYFKTTANSVHPKEFQKLLERISGTEEEGMLNRLILRSMKQAKYSVECLGHFGLSTKYYCHFTSPIRRYPDLQIHRIIKENLHGELNEQRIAHYERLLPKVTDESSKLERRAEEAERELDKIKKVEYMSRHIGETYEGIISGMHGWGMFVELPNTVEGMIPVTTMLDDYYFYDEEKYAMIGRDYHKEYRLGQKVRVRAVDTDRMMKTIDFVLITEEE